MHTCAAVDCTLDDRRCCLPLHCFAGSAKRPRPTQARPAKLDFVIFNVFVCSFSIAPAFVRSFFSDTDRPLPAMFRVPLLRAHTHTPSLFECTRERSPPRCEETFRAEIPRNENVRVWFGPRRHQNSPGANHTGKRLERVLCGERTTNPAMFFSSSTSPFLEFFSSFLWLVW